MVHAVIIIIFLVIAELLRNQTNVPRTELTCSTINSSPLCHDLTPSFCNMQILAQGDCQEKFSPRICGFQERRNEVNIYESHFFSRCVLGM